MCVENVMSCGAGLIYGYLIALLYLIVTMELECSSNREVTKVPVEREKRLCNDESLDSGIAGFKEPQCNDNKKSHQVDSELICSEYIVDSSTTTTYLKGRFLGKGGFAHVHELLDLTSNVMYAGKIISKNRITKRQHMQKIAREILIHRDLVHEHVVRLHHFFEDKINAYIILENCSRKSLVHVLKHRCVVTEPEVRYYIRQLVSGVRYIHSHKVIHRDLKPGNMLLSEKMVVKLADFGLATQADKSKKVSICGTPNYIAPEVLNKLSCNYEADVWAVGCIMFTILVGQPPFETLSLRETYTRIVSNKYTIPSSVSEPAQALIRDLLRPEPEARPLLENIFKYDFFTSGYTPDSLSPLCCYSVPQFVPPQPSSESRILAQLHEDMKQITNSVFILKLSQKSTELKIKTSAKTKTAHGPPDISSDAEHVPMNVHKDLTLKQKLSNILCSDKIPLCRKSVCETLELYQALGTALNTMPVLSQAGSATSTNPPLVEFSPLFVSKWIDYSNKYGFGFQLTDKSVGVLFNDNTRISFSPDRRRVEFHDIHGKITGHPEHSVPTILQGRLVLLRYFTRYMEENLTDGGEFEVQITGQKVPIPHMKRWVRTKTAIIMELHNGTLQINFFKDHTKLILSTGKQGCLVTYINCNRHSFSYWLHQIAILGCENSIHERLRFAAAVLREFAQLDGEKFSPKSTLVSTNASCCDFPVHRRRT